MTTERHSLSERDLEKRTAVCSIDGPVKIRKAGTGWTCAVRANAQKRKWNAKNPDRDRTSRSEHRLSARDTLRRQAVCTKCGKVGIVPAGRGWMCGERAKELGRVNHQAEPRGACPFCYIIDGDQVWLTAEGCPRCAEETNLDVGLKTIQLEKRVQREFEENHGNLASEGMHMTGEFDPYEVEPQYESAVAGWKTLG